jgi:hypothetical protein
VKSKAVSNKKRPGIGMPSRFLFYAVTNPTSLPGLPELQGLPGSPELPQEPERVPLPERAPRSEQVFAPLPSCSQRLQKILSQRKAGKE